MRVFIADDELLVRASLKSMLEEFETPVEIIGEATNGEEMIEGVKKWLPDVVFADIKMPKLTGLEGINKGKKVSEHTKWIILTGFSEFSYAQEAVKLGVSNYLLKPVSPDELKKTIDQLAIEQSRQLKMLNKEFENNIISLFYGLTTVHDLDHDFLINEDKSLVYMGAIFYLDSHLQEAVKADLLRKFVLQTLTRLHRYSTFATRMAIFPLPSGEVTLIGCGKGGKVGRKAINDLFSSVKKSLMDFSNENLTITMFISKERTHIGHLQENINDLERYAPLRTVLGTGRAINEKELNKAEGMLDLSEKLVTLAESFAGTRFLEYLKALDKLKDNKRNLDSEFIDNVNQFLSVSIGSQLSKNDSFEEWLKQLHTYGEQLLSTLPKREKFPHDIVSHATSYIDEHFMEDIGIGQIADELLVTPNYLSALFKKKTGITFMKYLTNLRMLKAKELLMNPQMQVKEVAEKVGYYSTRHFSKLFTETFGCYPSEYRNLILNQSSLNNKN